MQKRRPRNPKPGGLEKPNCGKKAKKRGKEFNWCRSFMGNGQKR